MRMWRALCAGTVLAAASSFGLAGGVAAQGLAEFDYENLTFRGIGLESGRIWPNNVDPTYGVGVRFDLGYLAPGFRLTPHVSYWDGDLEADETASFERRIEAIAGVDPGTVSLGTIEWSDFIVGLDGEWVWSVPLNFMTYAGFGASAHFMNGRGAAIEETFVEDLLDRIAMGFNIHVGVEYPFTDVFRIYASPRYQILDDLRYLEFTVGAKFLWGPLAPGEARH